MTGSIDYDARWKRLKEIDDGKHELVETYIDANFLNQREAFASFIRGFNMAYPLCDFIDAGNGKECSDFKIREITKLHVGDLHCKHIIFGGSTDNGYARMLGPYAGIDSISKRITMLEGPPFAPELYKLKQKFKTTAFPTVFRDRKLPPGLSSLSNSTSNGAASKSSSRAATVAPRIDIPPSPQIENPSNLIADDYDELDSVPRNSKGQRVDPPLFKSPQKATMAMINAVKDRHYCNNHHIYGKCSHYGCEYEHGEKLSGEYLKTLRLLARSTPCRNGLVCKDMDCYWGHQCARENCKRDCRYPATQHDIPATQHDIDTKIVNL
ncbi:hypothetical protein P7C71_g6210, partial [Lecanoromycetidae sp. Uapishka_2]